MAPKGTVLIRTTRKAIKETVEVAVLVNQGADIEAGVVEISVNEQKESRAGTIGDYDDEVHVVRRSTEQAQQEEEKEEEEEEEELSTGSRSSGYKTYVRAPGLHRVGARHGHDDGGRVRAAGDHKS